MMDKRITPDVEQKWLEFWNTHNVYAFDESDNTRPVYSIDTPPPFTSGSLHMGHVLSYSYFDFVARYKRMRGYNVLYPQGWDAQGFPTEVKVEAKYGKLDRVEFRKRCVEWTKEMIRRMKAQMQRLGFSADWKYEYITMNPEYHKKIQHSLIQMFEQGHVYRNSHPVMWCTHCRSAIAKAETDDVEREAFLNHVAFKSEESGEELVIATTRPELIPACVALMYHPEDERYAHLKGKYAITPLGDKVPIVADEDIEMDFGTGLMMVCTYGDKFDVMWKYRHGLDEKIIISKDGIMNDNAPEWMRGLKVEDARKKMLDYLKEKGLLKKQEKKQQVVKVHDRCKTPIEFLPSFQWFADVKKMKEDIIKWSKDVEWVPSFGINYILDWIEHLDWDWVISRDRVFGTPLPFYVCPSCGHTAAADQLPFYPESAPEKKCEKCGEVMRPETAVADCWIDSSITPLIISGWPDLDERKYPVSLRPQGVEIVRTWAFYTIYRCGVLTGKSPFKTILLNGNVLAPDGRKMSKSLGNVISPDELLKDYPVDAIRQWAALSGAMAKDRPFSYEDIRFAKLFLTKLWNSARFIQFVIEKNGYEDVDFEEVKESLTPLDRWVLGRFAELVRSYTGYMEKFEFHHALSRLHDVFWHVFCDHYIELVKWRVYGEDEKTKRSAIWTLKKVLEITIHLLAPISPYITEEIYHQLFVGDQGPSIHKQQWPDVGVLAQVGLSDQEKEDVELVVDAVAHTRRHRAEQRIGFKEQLNGLKILVDREPSPWVVEYIKRAANVGDVEIVVSKERRGFEVLHNT